MHQEKRGFVDKWMLRVKDALIIFSALGAFLVFGVKMSQLPTEVAAHAAAIQTHEKRLVELREADLALKQDLAVLNTQNRFIISGIDEIKRVVKREG